MAVFGVPDSTWRGRVILFVVAIAFGCAPAAAADRDGDVRTLEMDAWSIPTFRLGSGATRFGPFDYMGGLHLSSQNAAFGGLSAFRLLADGERFLAVSDSGYWVTGRLVRDAEGRLTGVEGATITALRAADGAVVQSRYAVDAEGLAVDGDEVLVSFERDHRIEVFSLSGVPAAAPLLRVPHPIPRHEFRRNRGMETVAVAPSGTPLDGAAIVVSERSLNPAGDLFAAIVRGAEPGVFFVRRHPPFDVTDGTFLPNGDLLLLERRFSPARGVGMRIRRIRGADIRPGQTVDGQVLLDVDGRYQIDNMESIEVYRATDGTMRMLLVSDDNHSLLQRTLLLEFRFDDR